MIFLVTAHENTSLYNDSFEINNTISLITLLVHITQPNQGGARKLWSMRQTLIAFRNYTTN